MVILSAPVGLAAACAGLALFIRLALAVFLPRPVGRGTFYRPIAIIRKGKRIASAPNMDGGKMCPDVYNEESMF